MQYNFSIVVPFYNEEENIDLFFEEIIKVISRINKKYKFEIICINDGSTYIHFYLNTKKI